MGKVSPCKGCTERTPGCHDHCERYKEWRAWKDDVNAWLKSQKAPTSEGMKRGDLQKMRRLRSGYEKQRGGKMYE